MIVARFNSSCPACGDDIIDGQFIETDPESGLWVHLSCLDHPDVAQHREICPVCHTARTVTGACMCEEDA